MNEKEVRELRKRFRADRGNISSVYGCYVNESRKIVSMFEQPLVGIAPEEAEQYLGLMKKTLSGTLGKNLVELAFSTQQVMDSDEHRLLSMLRSSGLKDDVLLRTFFEQMIEHLVIEGNYLILLTHDVYAVPHHAGEDAMRQGVSDEEFSYILCAVCPVKLTQPGLSYFSRENRFRGSERGWSASAPEVGFLFPAFDDRAANLYGTLYYTKDEAQNHQELIDGMFHTEPPMPAAAQKETFQALLTESLREECSLEVMQTVQEQIGEMIDQHKQNKEPEMLVVSKKELGMVLAACGVSKERVDTFETQFDAQFGVDAEIPPTNVVDCKHFEIRTPDVVIKVNPERSDLVETRVIDGSKYILICADGGMEVNGVPVKISEGYETVGK